MRSNKIIKTQKLVSYIPYFVLFILFVIAIALDPNILNNNWLEDSLSRALVLVLASVGQAFVMMISGTDLSIAGIISLTNCLSILILPDSFLGSVGTVLLMCLAGIVIGLVNGLIITKCKIQSFIVTMATWAIVEGFSYRIMPTEGGTAPVKYVSMLSGTLLGIPVPIVIIALIVVMWTWMRRTRFAISLLAIGKDTTAAVNAGIDVDRVQITAYAISGFFAALAGSYRTAFAASASPTSGNEYVLMTCCAVVLGGVNSGGIKGSIYGAIVGAIILELTSDILELADVSNYWTSFVQGLVLIGVTVICSLISINRKRKNLSEEEE